MRAFTAYAQSVAVTTGGINVMQIIGHASCSAAIRSVHLGFQGVLNTEASVLVELIRCTGGSGSAITPQWLDNAISGNPSTDAIFSVTGETPGVTVWGWRVHPQSSGWMEWPLGEEVIVNKATLLLVKMTAITATVSVTTTVSMTE